MPKEILVTPEAGQRVVVNPKGALKLTAAKIGLSKQTGYIQVEGTYVEPPPPIDPPPVEPPPVVTPPPTTEKILTLTPATMGASALDDDIDVIELLTGTYSGGVYTVDRTGRPLTIRPALGSRVSYSRPAVGSAIIAVGYGGSTKFLTFDGRAGGVGDTSSMFFENSTIAKDGFFETYTTDHVTYKYLTFQNNKPGTYGGQTGGPTTTWCWYIGLQGTRSSYMKIDNCWFKPPALARSMGVAQVYASGGGAAVDHFEMTNVRELTDYSVAFTCYGGECTEFLLSDWKMSGVNGYYSDCGTGHSSILFYGSGKMSGTYRNIVSVNSDPLHDCHGGGGTIINGGGNVL